MPSRKLRRAKEKLSCVKMLWKCFRRDHDQRDICNGSLAAQPLSCSSLTELSTPLHEFSSDREKLWKEMF